MGLARFLSPSLICRQQSVPITSYILRQRFWSSHAGESNSIRQYRCVTGSQARGISFTLPDRRSSMSTFGLLDLQEVGVRQVIGSAIKCSLAVPQHPWSAEYVVESVLSELTTPSSTDEKSSNGSSDSSVGSSSPAVNTMQPAQPLNSRGKGSRSHAAPAAPPSAGTADTPGDSSSSSVRLLPEVAALLENYTAAAAAAAAAAVSEAPLIGKGDGDAAAGTKGRSRNHSSRRADQLDATVAQVEPLQAMFGQLLYEEYQQVEEEDVAAFCSKLLSELSSLVETAQHAADGDEQGLCALCGRDMPLTKHHLIPRDVHKEFKKRGCSFEQLQAGLMVCRPCHSAIHRAVPVNKQLAMHYSTAEAISQHEEVAKFAAWARRQRVTSKGDVTSKHFKYRR